ncbi:VIT1/CCC1 transporter family protein [Methylohalobius crimeensis]|uniref:hypothetical protein n=1 Tax=Methylohalobius crimeensis TaxID=244365 RepID=UPI0003B546FC|nr:hypothetical protein [Methylohalobius crimeensis]
MIGFGPLRLLLHITQAHKIARRYLVTNGFDGALTMLGLLMGFYISGGTPLPVIINACFGAAIALAMSGLSSAYISEAAERKKELRELEYALGADLDQSVHGSASRFIPVYVAIVNGFSPFGISLGIISPLWLARYGMQFPIAPLEASIGLALFAIFLLGVFLGRISGTFWLWMGIKTTLLGLLTAFLILLVGMTEPG